jgi:hypothetical protein
MLIDLVFFGLPIILAICLAAHAIRDGDSRFWFAAFCWIAYCTFYLAGGRAVLVYLGSMALGGTSLLLW